MCRQALMNMQGEIYVLPLEEGNLQSLLHSMFLLQLMVIQCNISLPL